MKAIDFACRFLARMQQGELSLTSHQVIIAVAAGIETSPDIARVTGLAQGTCTAVLKNLEKSRLLICVCRTGGIFRLSSAGKDYVCRLFSFAKPQYPCEKNDT